MTSSIQRDGPTAVLRLRGDLGIGEAREVYEQLRGLAALADVRSLVVDFAAAGRLDSAGVATISLGSQMFEGAGKTLRVDNLGDLHRAALAMIPPAGAPPPEAPASFLEEAGDRGYLSWRAFVRSVQLIGAAVRTAWLVSLRQRRLPRDSIAEQAIVLGVDAVAIVALLSFLMGLILAFQSAVQLRDYGASLFLADLVALSMIREFGPMITAIILAGRSGAAIASELGSMTVRQEIDALRTMGVEPVRFLVLPRLIALLIVQPALSLMAMFLGIAGGLLISVWLLDVAASVYLDRVVEVVEMGDFWRGLARSVTFAVIIGITSCAAGLQTRGATRGVGRATTRAVVASLFLIIVADALFAAAITWARY